MKSKENSEVRLMAGVDLGLNLASVSIVNVWTKQYQNGLVFKFEKNGKSDWMRIKYAAERLVKFIENHFTEKRVSVEEPVYSWGRRNPKIFMKSSMLFAVVRLLLNQRGFRVIPVNNKSAKMMTGNGNSDKDEMIEAYKRFTGNYPGHSTRKGKETLADSYFIALAGYKSMPKPKKVKK